MLKKSRITLLLAGLLSLGLTLRLHAQNPSTGTISGTVISAQTREPIPGANIIITNTLLGAASDLNGHFIVKFVPPGTYAVRASMMGYKGVAIDVIVRAGGETELQFVLEETVIEIPSLIVTASKRYQDISDSPISVGVVTNSQIEKINETDLDAILQYAPGVNFMASQVNIRGSSGYSHGAGTRVLFLIDGVPVLPGDSGDIKWDLLPATQIERIEIVKGAGSALYGSNAMGGVINVITKEPSLKATTHLRLSGGVYADPAYEEWRWTDDMLYFNDLNLTHSRSIGKFNTVLSASRYQTTSYRQNGELTRWSGMGKFNAQLSGQATLELFTNWTWSTRGNSFMWQSQNHPLTAPVADLGDYVKSNKFNLSTVYRQAVHEKFGLKIRTSYFRNWWKDYFHDNNDFSRAQKLGFEAQGDLLAGRRHSLTFGSEEVYDHVHSNMFENHHSYGLSFYAQDEIKLRQNLLLTLGARYDFNHVDTGLQEDQLSPKLGLVWHLLPITTIRLSSGKGFRAPSVAERFTDVVVSGLRVIPSLNLRAETAWTHEAGVHQVIGRFMIVDIAAFHSDYWDLIEPEPDASSTVQFINITRARIRGLESSLQASLVRNHITTSVGATLLDPKDLDSNAILAYRAKYLFTGSITFSYGIFDTGFDYRYVSRLENVKVYPRDERVPQKVLDFRAGCRVGSYKFAVDINNIFNYSYTQIERTLMPIRLYSLTVSADF